MNWITLIMGIFVLWSSTAWGATLAWNANSEPDLGGYRIYQCSLQPCTKSSGNQSLLTTLGKVTSFNIGTPAVTQYYFITAYDSANNESGASNLVTFNPAGAPPPPPSPPPVGTVILTVLGNPATGAWGVQGTTSDLRNVMADVLFDGVLDHVEHEPPYNTVLAKRGTGPHTVQFVFKLEGTTTEIGRASITVQEGSPTPSMGIVKLTLLGNPATGAWGVEGTTTDLRDVMADVLFDGALDHVEHEAPYNTALAQRGTGPHTVQFIFKLEGTTTEIGRASMTVQEGPVPPSVGTVKLTVLGNPATGAWGVEGTTSDLRNVMADVLFDGVLDHVEHEPPYNTVLAQRGTGLHNVQFIFKLEGTTTEIGRASLIVQEGKP